jgi:hypothetical protein
MPLPGAGWVFFQAETWVFFKTTSTPADTGVLPGTHAHRMVGDPRELSEQLVRGDQRGDIALAC